MAERKPINIFDLTLDQIREGAVGDLITADLLNRPIRAFNRVFGNVPRGQQVIRPAVGTGGFGPLRGKQFKFVELRQDYFTAHSWDGIQEGDELVFIALPYEVRFTPFNNQTVSGISYVYPDFDRRIATIDGDNESQVIIPPYSSGRIVYAIRGWEGGTAVTRLDPEAEGEVSIAVEWLELNQGRAFAAEFVSP